jgi:hypothetical protein
MLILPITRHAWLVAASAAVTILVAGVVAAASLGPGGPPDPIGSVGLAAQPEVDCDDPNDPNCTIGDHTEQGGDPPPSTGGDPDRDGACTWTTSTAVLASLAAQGTGTIEIPCVHPEYGWWDGDHCYWSSQFPWSWPAPEEPPEGMSAEDGQWYYGTCLSGVQLFNGVPQYYIQAALFAQWFESAAVPVVTPEMVVLDWLAGFPLHEVEIRLSPPVTGSGLIDLPVWLGVDQAPETWGPIDASHCIGSLCATIGAMVTKVEWDMGDGTVVTCTADQHVAWEPGMPFLSPGDNCHHYYRRASRDQPGGKYQITATSTWAVHWEAEASAASGDLERTLTAEVSLQIDEIQVLVGDR